jgi:hypothetical protein
MVKMDKGGWIKIVEAFVALLLIVGFLLVILEEFNSDGSDNNTEIYEAQLIVLRDIQENNILRQSILDSPIPISSGDSSFPQNVKERIEYLSPSSLECEGKICDPISPCGLGRDLKKDIYAQSVIIIATPTTYNPKQLKIFCWTRLS